MSRAVKDAFSKMQDQSHPGDDPTGTSRHHPVHRGGALVGRQEAPRDYDPDEQPTHDIERELYKHGGRVQHKDHYASGGKPVDKWIRTAVKHKGAETNAAKKAGMSTHAYMEKHKHDSGTAGKRARLGLTLSGMSKKK